LPNNTATISAERVLVNMINTCFYTTAPTVSPAAPLVAGSISTSSVVNGFGFEKPVVGNTNDWLTPPALLERLGTFDLDPCGCPGMPWRTATTTYFLPEHDGLTESWSGRVWCNPPYGGKVGEWAKRMAEHQNGIMLIFARTDTKAWQRDVFPMADATLFLDGRVRFYLPSGEQGKSGTAPSALLAYGQSNVDGLRNAGIAGALCPKAEILPGIKASQL
jgi:DNA N-6-adenine-methyltransferase (Dam)